MDNNMNIDEEVEEIEENGLNLEEMHKDALKEYTAVTDYWDSIYTRALADKEFGDGDQWTDVQKKSRRKRPTIIENKVPQFIDKIVSPVREDGLKIKLMLPDLKGFNNTDEQRILKSRIEVYQGRISDIEQQSNAIDAYVKGIELSCTGGIGFIRVELLPDEYTGIPDIKIVRSSYPYGIYLDSSIEESTGKDAKYAFVCEKISKDEYADKYGKKSLSELASPSTAQRSWVEKDEVTVAEYFKIIETKQTILILNDGSEIIADDDITEETLAQMPIIGTRPETKKQLFHAKMDGNKFLEHTVLDMKCIPIVLVSGREIIEDKKRSLVGIVNAIRDAQVALNFFASAEIEACALSPKAAFMAPAQCIEPYIKIWSQCTSASTAVLPWDATPINGVAPPAPQRLSMVSQDFLTYISAKEAAFNDMKSNTGIYNIGMADQKIEESGKAILLREKDQSKNSNIYYFNLCESVKHVAKIIVEMLPMTFDPKVPIQMRTPNGKPQKLNLPENPYTLEASDIIIGIGKHYETTRTETADQLLSLMTILSPIVEPVKLMQVASMLTRSLNIVDSDAIADILVGVGPDGQPQQDSASIMADMQNALKLIETLKAKVAAQEKEINDKVADRELKADMAILDTKTKLALKEMEIQGQIEISQGAIQERTISQGGPIIPALVPNQNDVDTDVMDSVNNTTNQIIAPLDEQSNIAFEEAPQQPMQQPIMQQPIQEQPPMEMPAQQPPVM